MPLAGGMLQYGHQCGMIWGATLAAGAEAFRRHGPGPKAEVAAIGAAVKLVSAFRPRHDAINCADITNIDKSSSTWQMVKFFLIKGGTIGCFRMAAWYAPLAHGEIDSALSESAIVPPSPPVSCASLVARKMGASDMHAVMASGFAGGIGLCAGACGALGAAIWIRSMEDARKQGGTVDHKSPRLQDLIDRFLTRTNYTFDCADIVGRTFADVDDHASYLHAGGCKRLIDELAAD